MKIDGKEMAGARSFLYPDMDAGRGRTMFSG